MNYVNCGMQYRKESRTGRRCLGTLVRKGQTADSAEVSRSKPTQILMPISVPGSNSSLFDSKAGSGVNLPIMSVEKLKAESHS